MSNGISERAGYQKLGVLITPKTCQYCRCAMPSLLSVNWGPKSFRALESRRLRWGAMDPQKLSSPKFGHDTKNVGAVCHVARAYVGYLRNLSSCRGPARRDGCGRPKKTSRPYLFVCVLSRWSLYLKYAAVGRIKSRLLAAGLTNRRKCLSNVQIKINVWTVQRGLTFKPCQGIARVSGWVVS